ncbi:hydrogen gas-evolving membrane-bound hydrogenase subunit E [Ilumatobacter nonamiensis]|uniref:hydrogen gas-evolving membrane-bound hydrogenase subunit E n=1 Tax=Ilumatobacter nonamiensis TaxID=467093 RepID=UPI000683F354|nr:hydrogen gas-evolving membrane-bound hydrogenase subunit E [Ilumatobacter nonamiensis]
MSSIWWLLALHLALAAAAPVVARSQGSRVMLFCALAPAATLVWTIVAAVSGGADADAITGVGWVPELGLELTLRVDAFALLWTGIISGVGVAVFVYSASYFEGDPDVGAFATRLTAFAGAMLGIVVADNLLLLYVFWELTSVTSYLLIGTKDKAPEAVAAARRAFVVTAAGGLAMLAGFVAIGVQTSTFSLSALVDNPPSGTTATIAAIAILLGAFTKSAQFPFHGWLPGAMAAPTPASAYLHSATMVKAGVYLIARFAPIFVVAVPVWRPTVLTVGLFTMVFGGWVALRQNDLKILLAYGTVSQLGFLVVLFGVGVPSVTLAAVVMLVAHALFKSSLFLVIGVIDQHAGTRDLRTLTGLARSLRVTCVAAVLAAASMMGLPPLLGFVGKEKALEGFIDTSDGWSSTVLVAVVAGSILTVAYSARFLQGGFGGGDPDPVSRVSRRVRTMGLVAAVGSVAGLLGGLLAAPLRDIFVPAAASLEPSVAGSKVKLWAGFNEALLLSAIATVGGLVVFASTDRLGRLQRQLNVPVSWTTVYDGAVSRLYTVAERTTATVQNGSLPVYLGVIAATTLGVPAGILLVDVALPADAVAAESMLQVAACLLVAGTAIMAAVSGRRFVAALAIGGVGYGVALLFVIQGATDLALTQFLIETLSVVALVLVLRHLPEQFPAVPWKLGRVLQGAVAAVVGVSVVVLTLTAGSSRSTPSASNYYLDRALPDGGGKNVVNVILTDFRALDTLGEIAVLVIAALGVTSLLLVLPGGVPARRLRTGDSILLTRLANAVVPIALVFSAFLLFAGHNAPGGGFVGGLVAGAALTLEYARGGRGALERIVPFDPRLLLGGGLAIAALTGVAGLLGGGEFLESSKLEVDVPVLGTMKATSALPFDVGVFMVVVGLVVTVLARLGSASEPSRATYTERDGNEEPSVVGSPS